jgi:TRAP-type mannitol/chloroaromatic compound transport system permease small subunit
MVMSDIESLYWWQGFFTAWLVIACVLMVAAGSVSIVAMRRIRKLQEPRG